MTHSTLSRICDEILLFFCWHSIPEQCLPVPGRGALDAEGERSTSPFSSLAEETSADGSCWNVFMMPDIWRSFDAAGERDSKTILVGASSTPSVPFMSGFAGIGAGSLAASSSRGHSCFHDILGSIPHPPFQIPRFVQVFLTISYALVLMLAASTPSPLAVLSWIRSRSFDNVSPPSSAHPIQRL
jgi:hypothetical protein